MSALPIACLLSHSGVMALVKVDDRQHHAAITLGSMAALLQNASHRHQSPGALRLLVCLLLAAMRNARAGRSSLLPISRAGAVRVRTQAGAVGDPPTAAGGHDRAGHCVRHHRRRSHAPKCAPCTFPSRLLCEDSVFLIRATAHIGSEPAIARRCACLDVRFGHMPAPLHCACQVLSQTWSL